VAVAAADVSAVDGELLGHGLGPQHPLRRSAGLLFVHVDDGDDIVEVEVRARVDGPA
jgi:hypothetical protein